MSILGYDEHVLAATAARTASGDTGALAGFGSANPSLAVRIEDTLDGVNWNTLAVSQPITSTGREVLDITTPFADRIRARWTISPSLNPRLRDPMADDKAKGKAPGGPDNGPAEPKTKLEADQATGVDPHPGNVSDLSGQPVRRPKRAEKLGAGDGKGGKLVTEPVQGAEESEKIGSGPGMVPKGPAATHYRYQHVILPAGPDGDVVPGPESAAITACIAAGYRPVGEPTLEPVQDHPDGVSKVVTWSIPCVEAGDPAWREVRE